VGASRLGRAAMGERLAGFIYGTIVVLSVIVAGAKAYPDGPGHIAAIAVVTTVVFWLAHVYAHAVGHSVAHDEHLSLAELSYIARREGSIVEAALPPVAALALGHFGVISIHASVWLAFGLGLGVLGAQGITFARVERLGLLGTLVVVALNLCLGLALIALKLVVSH
jgi:hypothetical protein